MPVTQHAPLPVVLSGGDKSAPIPMTAPAAYSPSPVDIHPIVPHQPSRDPPSPSALAVTREETPKLSQVPSRSNSQRETTPQQDGPTPTPTNTVPETVHVTEEEEEEEEPEYDDEDIIDMETFQQILELDDSEEDREFSREMVWAYFSQAEKTFEDLDEALSNQKLTELSALGHFLKGSSAALGVTRVTGACEKIQHYGLLRDEDVGRDLTSQEALDLIKKTLKRVKVDYRIADKWLRKYYDEDTETS